MNYIADMHAKRRQLMWHHKARVLQNSYRAHLTRVRARGLSTSPASASASTHAAKPNSVEQPKAGSAFQQKRLPSKAMEIRKRKSVVHSGAAAAAVASSLSSPAVNEHRDADDAPPSLALPPAPAPETVTPGSRMRRMSM
jgi:hypothetical protein